MLFDLVFLSMVLAALVTIVVALAALVRGRRRSALRWIRLYLVGLGCYLAVVVAVSLATPRRLLEPGQEQCFDDWCVTIEGATRLSAMGALVASDGAFCVVNVRISNHARGRAQRASSAVVYLLDDRGRRYDVEPRAQAAYESMHGRAAPLTSIVEVAQSVTTVQVFEVPSDAHDLGAVVQHPAGPGPGLFVIGDEGSLFHKRTLVRL